jgi:hypothetical protein
MSTPPPVVLLHIAYEVISRLDRAEDFRLLEPEEQSLRDFIENQIASLQLVVEAQDTVIPSMAQDSLVFAHDSWHPQLGASSVGHCSGDGPLSPYALLSVMVGRRS